MAMMADALGSRPPNTKRRRDRGGASSGTPRAAGLLIRCVGPAAAAPPALHCPPAFVRAGVAVCAGRGEQPIWSVDFAAWLAEAAHAFTRALSAAASRSRACAPSLRAYARGEKAQAPRPHVQRECVCNRTQGAAPMASAASMQEALRRHGELVQV